MIFKPQFLESELPLQEYPRPQMQRNSYLSLNGTWQYAIRKSKQTAEYDGEILVPYSPECKASGVGRQLQKDEYLIYRRTFRLPDGFCVGKVLLNVGACDQVSEVFINGACVGRHEEGYLPYSLEITSSLIDGENEVVFVVRDNADSDVYGRGKQKYDRGGIWYTATSGIWQSVWLESVPEQYIKKLKLTPNFEEKTLCVQCDLAGEVGEGNGISVSVTEGEKVISTVYMDGAEGVIDVSACLPWSPQDPQLYGVSVHYGEDHVESYFGLRSFSVVKKGEFKYFAVNGQPVYHNGLLDQGYWSEGLYTPPSNRAMYEEIKAVKDLGFNMLRKHIKVEPLLWYYYCDVLGVLVWQDMINGGAKYPAWRIMLAPFFNLRLKDGNYKKMGRSERSRAQYYAEAHGLIDCLYNCVSLCLWTPFNEAWGQFDALETWRRLKLVDNTRPYDHASGWQDMGGGDVCSRHIYFRKAKPKNDRKRVLALTEFGGYSYAMEGHVFSDKSFGYKKFKDVEKLTAAYERLYEKEVLPLIEKQGLSATVYTELTDIEDEVNGLFTFDRVLKMDGERLKAVNEKVYQVFEKNIENTENTEK